MKNLKPLYIIEGQLTKNLLRVSQIVLQKGSLYYEGTQTMYLENFI